MSKNTAWGKKAYRQVRTNGGSKEEAKQASLKATNNYYQHVRERQFGKCGFYNEDVSDFNNSKNNGAWHTSNDL